MCYVVCLVGELCLCFVYDLVGEVIVVLGLCYYVWGKCGDCCDCVGLCGEMLLCGVGCVGV